jgi:hypothetical protein
MRAERRELAEALDGRFEEHHAELARILLGQIDALTRQIDQLSGRVSELIAQIPAAQGVDADGAAGPDAGLAWAPPCRRRWPGWTRSRAAASSPPGPSSPR